METFSYQGKSIDFPDEVEKWFTEFIDFYSVPSLRFFDTLEKLGFTFPVTFDECSEVDNCLLAKCNSADGKLSHYIKFGKELPYNKPMLTFVDVDSNEESSYEFGTGRPLRYKIKLPEFRKNIEFRYTYSSANDKGDKLLIKINFVNYEFIAALSCVHTNENYNPIPDILCDKHKMPPRIGSHVEIFEYLLYLDSSFSIEKIYETLKRYYSCNDMLLDFYCRPRENHKEKFSIYKLDVMYGDVREYAEHSPKNDGTFHILEDGSWFFNALNYSVHFSPLLKSGYKISGSLSEREMKMLPRIIKHAKKLQLPKL